MHCGVQLIVSIVTIAAEVISIKFSIVTWSSLDRHLIVTWSSLDRHDRRDRTSFYLHDCDDPDRHDHHLIVTIITERKIGVSIWLSGSSQPFSAIATIVTIIWKPGFRIRGVMDSNIPGICAFTCPLLLCTRLSFQIRETIKPVNYCKINDKAKKVREGNLICPDNYFTIQAI